MTTDDIVALAVNNHMVCQVYNALHSIILANFSYLSEENTKLSTERKLVKKFANVDISLKERLDAIKNILNDEDTE